MKYHQPVLLQEVISFLDPKPQQSFIDATIGGAGHALALIKKGSRVLGIDRDPEALEYINKKFQIGKELILVKGNFANIGQIAKSNGFTTVNGILFDLGVSSHQLEKPQRGFSFLKVGPLDMRMDPTLAITAKDLINSLDERRLYEIFNTYGQEKFSRSVARAICRARQIRPIEKTTELAEIINEVTRTRGPQFAKRQIGVKTRIFQALRIVVNSELLNLESALPQTVDLLKVGGRLVIISFHSLEDGLVKRFFKSQDRLRVITKKPVGPSSSEIRQNPKAKSAKLRVAEKI